ncbi:cysteine-rich DPF motif domain-containing protein 1 [Diprion similis]|uniref:cysteine-rich DPF motif domain-containing protein 1 n=1 Tax=Diprion similis TaxID=362088 RepID=UPI001EF84C30|nr:cysteine-rich DPF motif domain-containing protein 1 [Diprion similis]
MEPVATTSAEYSEFSEAHKRANVEPENTKIEKNRGETFQCSFCGLAERYDYKGCKPPFARTVTYLEECYIMKDPFSLPNRGEILVLGSDCGVCTKPVCLGCSLFFIKRFCQACAEQEMSSLPVQLHSKIKSLKKKDVK